MKKCGDCVHVCACELWNFGKLENANAKHCTLYETVKETSAYYLGLCAGKKEEIESNWVPCKTNNGNCLIDRETNLLDRQLKDIRTNILVTYETPHGRRYVEKTLCEYARVQKGKFGNNVVAWMPLPKPYREEADNDRPINT